MGRIGNIRRKAFAVSKRHRTPTSDTLVRQHGAGVTDGGPRTGTSRDPRCRVFDAAFRASTQSVEKFFLCGRPIDFGTGSGRYVNPGTICERESEQGLKPLVRREPDENCGECIDT